MSVDRPGGIFVRHAEHIAPEDRVLLQAVARAVISDRLGTPRATGDRQARGGAPAAAARRPRASLSPRLQRRHLSIRTALTQFNGTGGFSPDGREYVIAPSDAEHRPPAPWVNVIANPRFGTVVSEAGSAYTWCENAHELRLTPWHNDPVADTGGEEIFLRDEESGQVWSPTSQLPAADPRDEAARTPYLTRHGFGYSVFEHEEAGVHSELTVFVALDDAVKFSRLVLRNDSTRHRRLSATGYVEWVLGELREKTAPHIHTEIASDNGALYARNRYSNDFGDWIGFLDVDPGHRVGRSVTADRDEFIGRNGSLRRPAAMRRDAPVRSHRCRRSTRAARSRWRSSWRRASRRRSSSASAWAAAPTRPASWCSAIAAARRRGRRSQRSMRTGAMRSAPCRSTRPIRR